MRKNLLPQGRPTSNELIDAIDAFRGIYPQHDAIEPRQHITVAYPENDFQAVLEVARVDQRPSSIDRVHYQRVLALARRIHSDDALITYRGLMAASAYASLQNLVDTASWIARETYLTPDHPAIDASGQLRGRLNDVGTLEEQLKLADSVEDRDRILAQLSKARALLTRSCPIISQHADEWQLRLLKTSIRSYREVARAVFRDRVDATGPEIGRCADSSNPCSRSVRLCLPSIGRLLLVAMRTARPGFHAD